MAGLDELIDFIKMNPSGPEFWNYSKWETNLTKSVSNWRSLIAKAWEDPHEWERIENTRPKNEYHYLCKLLIGTIGLELAKRWFYSAVDEQQDALGLGWEDSWSYNNIHFWPEFDSNMKNEVLTKTFEWYHRPAIKSIE